jgi:hypothetical protein
MDKTTSEAEIKAIEDEEKDDEVNEELAQAEIDVVTEEEDATLAEKEAEDI